MGQIRLTTTGTLSPVVIDDLGARSFIHPVTNFNLLVEFTEDEVQFSADLQALIDAGHITLSDENAVAITTVQDASPHKHLAADVTDFEAKTSANADVAANTTHRGSSGTDHSDVVLNTTHRGSSGTDHSDVVLNTTHRGSSGTDHSDVVLNTTHRGSTSNPHAVTAVQAGAAPTVHSHTLADVTDSGALAPLDTVGTAEIDDDAVTNAKLANMDQALIKGRAAGAGTGDVQDLTAAQVLTILGVVGGTIDAVDVYDTTKQDIAMANTFQDLLFSTNQNLNGWTHAVNTNVFVCPTTGNYEATIIVTVGKTGGGASDCQIRALFNSVEIPMSVAGMSISNNNSPQQISVTFPFSGTAAQNLEIEVAGGTTSVDAPILPGNTGSAATVPTAWIRIKRLS